MADKTGALFLLLAVFCLSLDTSSARMYSWSNFLWPRSPMVWRPPTPWRTAALPSPWAPSSSLPSPGPAVVQSWLPPSVSASPGFLQAAVASPWKAAVASPWEEAVASPWETRVASPWKAAVASPWETGVASPLETRVASPWETRVASPREEEFSPHSAASLTLLQPGPVVSKVRQRALVTAGKLLVDYRRRLVSLGNEVAAMTGHEGLFQCPLMLRDQPELSFFVSPPEDAVLTCLPPESCHVMQTVSRDVCVRMPESCRVMRHLAHLCPLAQLPVAETPVRQPGTMEPTRTTAITTTTSTEPPTTMTTTTTTTTTAPPTPDNRNCMTLQNDGVTTSGVYTLDPGDGGPPFSAYCDMDTEGGGWTVFQRRTDDKVNFTRTWEDYKNGFGDLNGNHWLGNEFLHRLTAVPVPVKLRVDLESFGGVKGQATYSSFALYDEADAYRLSVTGYSGDVGDALRDHHGKKFSTIDRDNDPMEGYHCAQQFNGGWWYNTCVTANLNGMYGQEAGSKYMVWLPWSKVGMNSVKSSQMMIHYG